MTPVNPHATNTATSFTSVAAGARHALVRHHAAERIAAALLHGERCHAVSSDGRGDMLRFPLDHGRTALIRTYRRGGLLGPLLNERLLFVNRPLRELLLLAELHAQGLPVPDPLGARWERSGIVYRGAIATVELNARHLQHVLRAEASQAAVLPEVGAVIRRFHDAGLFHADLQIRNILVDAPHIYLIDFDRARRHPALAPHQRWANLLRLRRSLQKNGFPEDCFQLICTGYGVDHLPRWLDRAYRLKGRMSDRLQGRGAPRS
jgi:3-deoxy-D-manno-octulosonic acid kinase